MSNTLQAVRRVLPCVLALAMWLGGTAVHAQSDVIRGRVTDPEGQPLINVRVTATSVPGNVTRQTQTNAQGQYQIVFPGGPGDYIMGFAHYGYAFRQTQVKRLADEAVLIADARLSPVQLDSLIAQASVQQRVSRTANDPDVSGTERQITPDMFPPEVQGDIAAMAASLPGVLLVPGMDGEPDGFSVLGMGADQNNVTLNGMQSGMGSLPRDAGVFSSLVTSPFDVSRGGFSGGSFNISTRAGSNFRSRGSSLVFTTPQMQWTDRAGQALGNDYNNFSLSGMASGPLQLNRTFYNVSYQLARQSRDYATLLGTNAVGLQTAGVAPDSVDRFAGIVAGHGIPLSAGPVRNNRLNDSGMLFGSIDLSPPSSSSGTSWNLTFNGNWNRQTPVTSGVPHLSLASTAGDRTNWGGGVQARHSAYLGMILTETTAGVNLTRAYDEPYLELPGGRVRINSTFDDGGSGVQTLTFGGSQGMRSDNRSMRTSLQNQLSWFDNANKHRIKLTSELAYSGDSREQASNLLGTFNFNSLEDFEAGRPSSYSRTLTARQRSTGQLSGAISLGDSYRRSQDLQFQYGVRVDGSAFTTTPERNAAVESAFGRRNDELPRPIVVSPRIGFSWTVGQAQEVGMFAGAARAPRAVIRGGIGLFASNMNANLAGTALDNTGLPSGVQQIMCVGPAVPLPNWTAYGANSGSVPDRCADGTSGSVFSSGAPNVSLFEPGFGPSRTVRSNLSWSGAVLDARFNLSADATYSLNLNQMRTVDLNFDPTARFSLGDDGRPVYVAPSSIVPATGAIAVRDARVSNAFNRVTEFRSDLQSRTAQASLRLSPIARGPTRFGWNLSYTMTDVREQVSGFNSTAGNPLGVEWATSAQGPHQISYGLRYNLFDAVQLSWNGSFRSGMAYTPMVAGDINGDGYSNDRAFIPTTSGGDAALAAQMRDLLANASPGARSCLEEQLGQIAERNSCRGPWTSSASLSLTLDRAKFRIPQRGAISFSLSNPLGAADLLLNGSDNLRGWGQSAFPDQSLLYVRGFDQQTQRYQYEVNQRFGATRPQFATLRSPVTLTASLRYDLGPTREQQSLGQQLRSGRSQPGMRFPENFFRSLGANAVTNPLSTILRQQDSLQLNSLQADSIAAMNRRYMYQADSLWTPIARELAALPNDYDESAAYAMYLSARRAQIELLTPIAVATRELLTAEQRRKLPPAILNFLDPRHLALIRNGTGMYIGGSGLGPMGGGGVGMPSVMIQSAGAGIEAVQIMVRQQ